MHNSIPSNIKALPSWVLTKTCIKLEKKGKVLKHVIRSIKGVIISSNKEENNTPPNYSKISNMEKRRCTPFLFSCPLQWIFEGEERQ
jgi:hypothetical protein